MISILAYTKHLQLFASMMMKMCLELILVNNAQVNQVVKNKNLTELECSGNSHQILVKLPFGKEISKIADFTDLVVKW